MKSEISLQLITRSVSWFFHRFHVVLFVVLVFGSLAGAVLLLSQIVQSSTDTDDQKATSSLSTSFDQETIRRIEELNSQGEDSGDIQLPPGRINPFVE